MRLKMTLLRWWRRDSLHDHEVDRRLDVHERKAREFTRRIKRVEIEMGIVHPDVVNDGEAGGSE